MEQDTIVAIATAVGRSSISVLRISGPGAFPIVGSVFSRDIKDQPGNTIVYGRISDGSRAIDQVLLSLFRAPHSFTGEDVIEISCHGGAFVTNEILSLILSRGARMAEAGEFSKRAFLNGKIDLSEAEAIIGIIDADSKKSLQMANVGLSGAVRKRITSLQEKLASLMATIEVNIDYPEYESENAVTERDLLPGIAALSRALKPLKEHAEAAGHIARGINVVILGRPNVGKSTLLNALVGESRAIVTPIPGTTRDIIRGDVTIDGLVYHLSDTAGLRKTSDPVEKEGLKRARKALKNADIAIVVVDSSREFSAEDREALNLTKNKKRILIASKEDINPGALAIAGVNPAEPILHLSLLRKQSVARIKKELALRFASDSSVHIDDTFLGSVRQAQAIAKAIKSLQSATKAARAGYPIDIIEIDLEEARRALGEITGSCDCEQVIDEVFSRFCVGK